MKPFEKLPENERLAVAENDIDHIKADLQEINSSIKDLIEVTKNSGDQMMNVANNALHQTQQWVQLMRDELAELKKDNKEHKEKLILRVENLEDTSLEVKTSLKILKWVGGTITALLGIYLKFKG